MAVNTKSGVVLAVGQPQQIASQRSGKTYTKRTLYLDCTTFDPYTGQRSQYENKLLFEFMESKTALLDNIKPGQVVTVSFDLQGTEITDQAGQTKHYIHVRPFGVEIRQMQQPQAPQQQYAPQPAPQYQPQPQAQQFPPQQADSDMPF
jgi:hypothetical protein